ncbi:MAG: hypothetical protein WC824_12440 [Bacteroidota bacterium]|jgi:hypothetical protein
MATKKKLPEKVSDEITFNIPITVTTHSRDIKGDHYSREVAKLAMPILYRLHEVKPSEDGTIALGNPVWQLHDAACRLCRGQILRVTMKVCKDGSMELVRAEQCVLVDQKKVA